MQEQSPNNDNIEPKGVQSGPNLLITLVLSPETTLLGQTIERVRGRNRHHCEFLGLNGAQLEVAERQPNRIIPDWFILQKFGPPTTDFLNRLPPSTGTRSAWVRRQPVGVGTGYMSKPIKSPTNQDLMQPGLCTIRPIATSEWGGRMVLRRGNSCLVTRAAYLDLESGVTPYMQGFCFCYNAPNAEFVTISHAPSRTYITASVLSGTVRTLQEKIGAPHLLADLRSALPPVNIDRLVPSSQHGVFAEALFNHITSPIAEA